MTCLRHLLLSVLTLSAFLAPSGRGAAQPLLPAGDGEFGGTPGMHLFLQSGFIRSIREDRLLFARIRHYNENYNASVERKAYAEALAYNDSLIRSVERHRIHGVKFTQCYKDRARLLKLLHRDFDACVAYNHAVAVLDSIMRVEQSEVINEMQATYQLDRLALDKALLRADHHKKALIAVSLLLLALLAAVGVIYIGNRRNRRLQRELLLKMQQAHESELKKMAFVNSICHEVRTPLNSIAGFAELLCTEDTSPESHVQYCEIIQQSRRQLRYLFDDMLEVAYLENLHEALPLRHMDLCALCRTQLRILKVKYPKQGIVYRSAVPHGEIAVRSSDKYLSTLLAALLGNANKFTQQGTITLACGIEDEKRAFIAVEDTGCGIPPEKYAFVFERFTKLDAFSQGNGLGLYLCRLIVRHLHGEIRIDPGYTGGTRIVVILPRE